VTEKGFFLRLIAWGPRQRSTAAIEGDFMKRILIVFLLFVGFFVASCEEEEHERRYGYHEGGYREPREYPREHRGYRDGYYGPGYRFLDETIQNDVVLQVETTVEP
jgi:hypothetical protein